MRHVTEGDLALEESLCLNHQRKRVDQLADGLVPPEQCQTAHHESTVVGDDRAESASQNRGLGPGAAVEADRFGGITQAYQRVAERGIREFIAEAQQDQRATYPERDHRGGEHIEQSDPEQRMVEREAQYRQRTRQTPQDRGERHHRHHRVDPPEQQGACRSDARGVRSLAGAGGERVDIELDALIGVVDRALEEPAAVEGLIIEPVRGETFGQPYPPSDDEALGQIDVDQLAADIDRRDQHEGHDRDPESAHTRLPDGVVAGAEAFECHLE